MTIDSHNPNKNLQDGADATLRLIATLPAPQGLEERVHQKLGAARALGEGQAGRLLAWPGTRSAGREWMRTAAAAAIAFVIVGGGWGVYRQVQPLQAGGGIRLAPRGAAAGGFAGASARRTPETLNGPVLTHPVVHAAVPQGAPMPDANSGAKKTGTQAEKAQPAAGQKKRGEPQAAKH